MKVRCCLFAVVMMLALPKLSHAQDTNTSLLNLTRPTAELLKLAAFQGPSSNNPKAAWLADVEATKKKRDRGFLIGVGGLGGGVLIAMLAGTHGSANGAIFGGLIGAGCAGYGGWTYTRAKDHLEDLDREGRAKGYSFLPRPTSSQPAFVLASLRF